jgi:hypothetical protein
MGIMWPFKRTYEHIVEVDTHNASELKDWCYERKVKVRISWLGDRTKGVMSDIYQLKCPSKDMFILAKLTWGASPAWFLANRPKRDGY